jgi:hypothetical protein
MNKKYIILGGVIIVVAVFVGIIFSVQPKDDTPMEIGKGTTFNSNLVYKQDSPLWGYSETYPKELGASAPMYGGPGYVVIFKGDPTFLFPVWTKGGTISKDANGKMYYEKGYEKILPADIAKKVDEVLATKGYVVLKFMDYGGYDEPQYAVTDY